MQYKAKGTGPQLLMFEFRSAISGITGKWKFLGATATLLNHVKLGWGTQCVKVDNDALTH